MTDLQRGILIGAVVGVATLLACILMAMVILEKNLIIV